MPMIHTKLNIDSMKPTYLFLAIIFLGSMCSFADGLKLALHSEDFSDVELKVKEKNKLSSSEINLEFNSDSNTRRFLVFMQKGEKFEFNNVTISRKNILKLLTAKPTLEKCKLQLGCPNGRRPDYIGEMLRKTWNLYTDRGNSGSEYYIITAYFHPIKDKNIEQAQLKGYSILCGTLPNSR